MSTTEQSRPPVSPEIFVPSFTVEEPQPETPRGPRLSGHTMFVYAGYLLETAQQTARSGEPLHIQDGVIREALHEAQTKWTLERKHGVEFHRSEMLDTLTDIMMYADVLNIAETQADLQMIKEKMFNGMYARTGKVLERLRNNHNMDPSLHKGLINEDTIVVLGLKDETPKQFFLPRIPNGERESSEQNTNYDLIGYDNRRKHGPQQRRAQVKATPTTGVRGEQSHQKTYNPAFITMIYGNEDLRNSQGNSAWQGTKYAKRRFPTTDAVIDDVNGRSDPDIQSRLQRIRSTVMQKVFE